MTHHLTGSPSDQPVPVRRIRQQLRELLLPLIMIGVILVLLNAGMFLRLSGRSSIPPAGLAQAATEHDAPAQPDAADGSQPNAADQVPLLDESSGPGDGVVGDGSSVWLSELVATDSPVWRAQFGGKIEDSAWAPFSGEWAFDDGMLRQADINRYDLGILYEDAFENYVYSVNLRHTEGVGAGLLFNVPTSGSVNGGHLIRFTDDNTGIFWGHFDEAGLFTGQGYYPTGPAGRAWHLLQVASGPSSYSLYFDGALIAADIPLYSMAGFPGLTTSQSAAEFKDINVYSLAAQSGRVGASVEPNGDRRLPSAADNRLDSTTTRDLPDLETISGLWVQEQDGLIRQESTEPSDYTLGTGIAAENYRLEVTIGFDESEVQDAGGGILFHMPSRTDMSGAQMVRFVNAGQGITWGYFDDDANYIGQGYADLGLEAENGSRLQLVVDGSEYDLLVDDVLIVDGMEAVRGDGWIALTSYRGPVGYQDIQLSLGSVIR